MKGPKPYPVRIRGTVFPSVKAASIHFGVATSTIYAALTRGTIDNVGLGPGASRAGNPELCKPKPIRIGPCEFNSLKEASLALGFHRTYFSRVLRTGKLSLEQRTNVMKRCMEHKKCTHNT